METSALRRILLAACMCVPLVWHPQAYAQADDTGPYGALRPTSTRTVSTPQQRRIGFLALASDEAKRAGVPLDLVDAVMQVESNYDPSRIGSVGEVGLMQVRPTTATMLGFKGSPDQLADPATNIHYGTTYLGQAWHLANGDICRALMKYRAGHGSDYVSPLSETYCARARAHLASIGSALSTSISVPVAQALSGPGANRVATRLLAPKHGAAFWAAEMARVRMITARVHTRWKQRALRAARL
jgi:hypothetical protein